MSIMPESALCLNSTCLLHLVMSIHVTYNSPNQGARVDSNLCVETEIYCHMCLFSDASFLMVWYVFIQFNVENEYLDYISWEIIQECKRLVLRYKQFCVPHFSPFNWKESIVFPIFVNIFCSWLELSMACSLYFGEKGDRSMAFLSALDEEHRRWDMIEDCEL
jgi:hypothetical protein